MKLLSYGFNKLGFIGYFSNGLLINKIHFLVYKIDG